MTTLKRRPDLVVVPALVVAAALVFLRALGTRTNYDEGVYLASLELLRRGADLGSAVYTPQPPVFYWLLEWLSAPFGQSIHGIRAALAGLAVVGVIAAYATARELFGIGAGAAAGFLLVIAPPFPAIAATVAADVPSLALGLVALALVARVVRPAASRGWAAAAGALAALAVLTKFLAVPFLAPLVAIPIARRAHRRVLPAIALGGVTTILLVLLVNVGSVDGIWQGSVVDHESAKSLGSVGDNFDRLIHLLGPRTPIAWLVPAGVVAFVLSRRARSTWPLATIVPAAVLFTLYARPLLDHHLSLMSCALAISAGPALALGIGELRRELRITAVALVALLVAAGVYQEQRRQERNDIAEPAEILWAARVLDEVTGPDDVVATDQPVVVFRARRPLPGDLTDTSNTRVASGALTTTDVLEAIDGEPAAAVVVGRMFTTMPGLQGAIARRFPYSAPCGTLTVYLPRAPDSGIPSCPVPSSPNSSD